MIGRPSRPSLCVCPALLCPVPCVWSQPDLSQLQLDAKLEPIFGTKQLAVAALPQALGALLQPLEPVTITHAIG